MSDAQVVHESDVEAERWSDDLRGRIGFRTLLGAPGATTPDFSAGVAELEPGGWLGHHRHVPAEVYFVLTGNGTVTIDGVEHAVTAGTCVYVPGSSDHGIRNAGAEVLRFFYAFGVGSFGEIEYTFSAQK